MIGINTFILALIGLFASSCASSVTKKPLEKYCGYEMSDREINEISIWNTQNPNAYGSKNGTEIYSEINDSIRLSIPDSITFELFLIKLTDDEVTIDSYVPDDKKLIKKIVCVFMKTKFSDLVPKNKKIRFYTYSNPDGSGNSPFEIAIKN